MKKTYIKFTVLFCALVFAVVVLGVALFTHIQINAENQRCMDNILHNMNLQPKEFRSSQDDFDLYMVSVKAMQFFDRTSYPEVGYYGKSEWTWNKLKITRKLDSSAYQHGSTVIGENGSHSVTVSFSTPEENGDYSVTLYRSQITSNSETVITEADLKGVVTHVTYLPSDSNDMYPLDAEAKELFERLESEQNGSVVGSKLGWFTSYLAYDNMNIIDGSYTIRDQDVFVFHPFSMVFQNYLYVYILFLIVLVVLQALTVIMMRRVYVNRVNYESRTKNLTRSFAHELKTPLAVTKSYVENWDLIGEDERPEIAAKIVSEVDHMTRMVNTLLDISKMDAGDFKLNLEDVDLFALTNVCFRHMEELARKRNIEVDIRQDKDDGECIVSADLDMMKMVISNFMSNAVKYGKSKVEVLLVNGSNNVTFKITNDGEPISRKDQKRIWDLFYKKDKSGSDRLSSTGVGLAVNKSILDIHKAKFGVESNASGTTFWFEMKKAKE